MELHNLKEAKKAGKIEAFLNKFVDDNTGTIDFSDVDYFVRQVWSCLNFKVASKLRILY